MANIYRKTALDKLSSPDQLDRAITIISPSFWIATTGMGVIVVIALVWAIFGRIPISVSTDGIYMNPGGIRSVAAATNGFVDEVYVINGDAVTSGQELAHIDTANIEQELAVLKERRASVEKVTFDSENDVGSADNKALLDIKAQKIASNATLNSSETALASREQELERQRAATESARQEYEAARAEYLDSMDASGTSAQQVAYQDAQTALSTSKQYYESARSSFQQAEAQRSSLEVQKADAQSKIDQINASIQQAQTDVETANTELATAQTNLQTAQDQLAGATTEEERAAAEVAVNEAQQALQAAQANLQEKSDQLNKIVEDSQGPLSELQGQIQNLDSQLKQQEAQYQSAQASVDEWSAKVDQAQADYNAAEEAYVAAMNASTEQQGNTNKQSTAYNVALQKYTSEVNSRRSLEDSTLQLMAQVSSDKANLENQNSALKMQFNSARAGVLDQLDKEIKVKEQQIKDSTIRANRDGYVAGMNIAVGNAVQQGSTVCRIAADQGATQEIICYAPVTQGRKMKPGMEAMVYPSTVNRQEYGHIKGTVLEVSDYVISSEEMANQIGDNSLVQMFQQKGPVVRVLCELEKDNSTVSGYRWSSEKGAEVEVPEGTIVSVDVVTDYKAPISMVIPYLKEQFTRKSGDSSSAN